MGLFVLISAVLIAAVASPVLGAVVLPVMSPVACVATLSVSALLGVGFFVSSKQKGLSKAVETLSRLPIPEVAVKLSSEVIEGELPLWSRDCDSAGMGNTVLINMAVTGDRNIISFLDRYPNYSDYIDLTDNCGSPDYGNSALILACMGNQSDIASKLIDCGANVNQTNRYGTSPLHYACLFRNE